MGTPRLTCTSHRAAAAGWRCDGCDRLLCPACTAQKRAQTVYYPVCTACGGAAAPLRVHRAERSYAERIRGAWRYPLSPAGLLTMGAAGLVIYLFSFLGQRGVAIGVAILWSYVFTLIRRTADGSDSLDPPDFTDFSDIATPGFRGALATAVLWVPAALYLHFSGQPSDPMDVVGRSVEPEVAGQFSGDGAAHLGGLLDHEAAKARAIEEARRVMGDEGVRTTELEQHALESETESDAEEAAAQEGEEAEEGAQGAPDEAVRAEASRDAARQLAAPAPVKGPRPAWKDPVLWLLVVFGMLWMPVAILSSAAGGSALEMLNPLRPIGLALRIPREYAVAVVACAVLALAGLLLVVVGRLVAALPIPLLAGWAGASVSTYVPLVAGRVLGMLLFVRGADIGYAREEDAYEPALPGAEPQGTLPAALQGRGSAFEPPDAAAPEAGVAAAPRRRHAPIELEEETPVAAAQVMAAAAAAAVSRPAPQRVMGLQGVEGPGQTQRPPPQRVQGVERAGQASAGPGGAGGAAAALLRAVQAQDLAQALQVYPAALREPGAGSVPAACHHAVGRHAASQGQYPLAVQALRAACAAEPAGPLAAQSLVLMARLLQERMGDAAGAQRVYAHVVQHYAGSEAARFAQGRLPPRAG